MKKTFYIAVIGIVLFEIANVYFIMPMPGSQRMNSVGLAHFLNAWKWFFRVVLYAMLLAGLFPAMRRRWWLASLMLLLAAGVTLLFNLKMTASSMFRVMKHKTMASREENKLDSNALVIGVVIGNEARAYPINIIAYHHRVFDTVGGKLIMATYCSVCRTGRVFEPVVNGKEEAFRLVGMDHFNAMFEDKATGSWWRQENGVAVAGELKGSQLPEIPCQQMRLAEWFELHPGGRVLQEDPEFAGKYKSLKGYDAGTLKSTLLGHDTGSWNEKSWVAGLADGIVTKAYDWNYVMKHPVVDELNHKPVLLWISPGGTGLFAFYLPAGKWSSDSLMVTADNQLKGGNKFTVMPNGVFKTEGSVNSEMLKQVNAYQEFWHSWRTFHSADRYEPARR